MAASGAMNVPITSNRQTAPEMSAYRSGHAM
jgi:hypothetical protein